VMLQIGAHHAQQGVPGILVRRPVPSEDAIFIFDLVKNAARAADLDGLPRLDQRDASFEAYATSLARDAFLRSCGSR
jgi:hypothetical protein